MLVEIRKTNEDFVARTRWRNQSMRCKFSSMVQYKSCVYGLDDGILCCIDIETGARRWKSGRYGHGQLILVNDSIVVQCESGEIAIVGANEEQYVERARIQALDHRTWNHPAFSDGVLLLRNNREAMALRFQQL